MLLLGSDVRELIVPTETRCAPEGSLVSVRTKIQWTVTGRLPGYIRDIESVYKVHMATPDEVLHEIVKTCCKQRTLDVAMIRCTALN